MSDTFFTPRRVRIALRVIGFLMIFVAVLRLLGNFFSAVFGSREFFGEFLPLDLLLGGVTIAGGAFLVLRAADLARWLAEEREA